MEKLMLQRAIFNKNTNEKLGEYLSQLTNEQLTAKKGISILMSIKKEGSALDLFKHIVYVEIFYCQMIKLRGLQGKYNSELLEFDASLDGPDKGETLEELITLGKKSSQAMVELFESLEEGTLDIKDLVAPISRETVTPFVLLESLLNHSTHHRGQLTQIITEFGVGEDLARFTAFGF